MKQFFIRLLVLALFSNLIFPAACKKSGQDIEHLARVTFISGEVTRKSADGASGAINLGDYLKAGDVLKTGEDALVEVFIKGQGIVRISGNSEVNLQQMASEGDNRVLVNRGGTAFFLRKEDRRGTFSAATPTAVAGVRGTTFLVQHSGQETRVALFDGALSISNDRTRDFVMDSQGEIVIRPGQDLTREMIRPHSKESLEIIKRLAVFQKNNILEYNTLVDELKKTEVIQGLEVNESVSDRYAELRDEDATDAGAERLHKAEESTIKRDTKDEQLKLPANRQYNR